MNSDYPNTVEETALKTWAGQYLNQTSMSEDDYEAAINAAARLRNSLQISHLSWIKLIKLANASLCRNLE